VATNLIKGVTVEMGGKAYVVPPLNLEQVEQHAADIDRMSAPETSVQEQRRIQVILVAAAMSRNYPELTEAQVKRLLDMGNIIQVTGAIMGVSGFVPAGEPKPGETGPEE
jgi:hypothetical protein